MVPTATVTALAHYNSGISYPATDSLQPRSAAISSLFLQPLEDIKAQALQAAEIADRRVSFSQVIVFFG